MTDITKFNRNGAIRNIGDAKVRNDLAPSFSTEISYSTNDICIYDGELYRFTNNHNAGSWSGTTDTELINISDNFVRKTGDTLNGDLFINKSVQPSIQLIHSTIQAETAPETNTSIGSFVFSDKNGELLGYINTVIETSKLIRTKLQTNNKVGNTWYYNYLQLQIEGDGKLSVAIPNNENLKTSWRNAIGLEDSGWQPTTNAAAFSGTFYYRKIGKIVEVKANDIKLATGLNQNSGRALATVPTGYRPISTVIGSCYTGTTILAKTLTCCIDSSGNIYIIANPYGPISETDSITATFTYFID